MKLLVKLFVVLDIIVIVMGTSYFFGKKTDNASLIFRDKFEYYALPWMKRKEYFTYNDTLRRPIKAIDCHDYERAESTVNITQGGIGYPFVILRFESPSSYGLNYAIEIYA